MSDETNRPTGLCLTNSAGLRAEINLNGSLRRFDCGPVCLALFVGNEIEGGPTNIFLRRHTEKLQWTALLGPLSPTRFYSQTQDGMLFGQGSWMGIDYSISLRLSQTAPCWYWHVTVENVTSGAQYLDLTYAQDLALASYGAVRLNEFYVSQYLDHTPLTDRERGFMIASRQNAAVDGRIPWCLIGSLRSASGYATDARQLHGMASRLGSAPVGLLGDLPSHRLQHEHAMAILRDAPMRLEPGTRMSSGFFGLYQPHHPEATSIADLKSAGIALSLPEAMPSATPAGLPGEALTVAAETIFSGAPVLNGLDLDATTLQTLFGSDWRHEETGKGGEFLSFFYGTDRHVVLRGKELRVQRPHGHLLRTGRHITPDETALTSTVWMSGVFHSMVTQGHVSINRLLSTVHSYLGLFRSHGQRVFVDTRRPTGSC